MAVAVDGAFDGAEAEESEEAEESGGPCGGVHAGAGGDAEGGDEPDGGGGGEALDAVAVAHDGACAEEADTGDDVGADAAGVVSEHGEVGGSEGLVGVVVDRDDHEEGGGERDDDVRAQAGGSFALLAFDADECAEEDGAEESQAEVVEGEHRWIRERERAVVEEKSGGADSEHLTRSDFHDSTGGVACHRPRGERRTWI